MPTRRSPDPAEEREAVEQYLAALPRAQRAALEHIRSLVLAAAPAATCGISYRIPTFKLDGRPLVSFAAFKEHLSFFGLSTTLHTQFQDELRDLPTSKGTIRFTVDKPLPDALVTALVRARIEENEAMERARKARPRALPNT